MRARVDGVARHLARHLAGQRIEQRNRLDGLVEQLDAHGLARRFRREHVDDVAAHAVRAGLQVELVARVLHVRQPAQQPALVHVLAAVHVQDHLVVGLGIAEAVDRRDRGNDDRVAALQQRLGRREAHLLDVLVDGRVLLDVRVARGHVGLGLVVVVVRDEILHRVLGKEFLELAIQLRGQRLVVGEHQRGTLHVLDHRRHRERLSRSGDAEQRLVAEAVAKAFHELRDGLRLVAGGLVVRFQDEGLVFHGCIVENRKRRGDRIGLVYRCSVGRLLYGRARG